MTNNLKSARKHILNDPVVAYQHKNPQYSESDIANLKGLWLDYQASQQTNKKLAIEKNSISSQFANARSANQSVNELKLQMQELGREIKEAKKALKQVENAILAFFEEDDAETATDIKPIDHSRCYPNTSSPEQIIITELGSEISEWNEYIDACPYASIYHRAEWAGLINRSFGNSCRYYLARNTKGKVAGVLPLIELNSRLFGHFMVSMPYFNYGGAIADSPEIEQALIRTANDYAAQKGISHIEYRDDLLRDDMPGRQDKVNMLLPLPESEALLWDQFSAKLRAQINRPLREKPEILIGKSELLNDFYRVFSHNMRDLGTPVYSKQFFQEILTEFPGHATILIIKLNRRAVGAAFLLGYKETLEIPWASTLRKYNYLGINMLMYWQVLRYAIRHGYQYFDFGRSTMDSGTYRFKKQWGAQAKQLYWHYWLPGNSELPQLTPANKKYQLAINLWQKLPVFVTQLIGPHIVKNLP